MRAALGILVWLFAAEAAAELPLPAVEFTGEGRLCLTLGPRESCSDVVIRYTPKRWRVDQVQGPQRTTEIYDVERKRVTVILHGAKRYTVSDFDPERHEANVGFLPTSAIRERIGEEAVDGRAAAKYRLQEDPPGGSPVTGFAWVTSDNIVARVEAGAPFDKGRMAMSFHVTRLVVAPVDGNSIDASIPNGYERVGR